MRGKGKVKTPPIWKLILKLLAILFVLLFWYGAGRVIIETIIEETDYAYNKADAKKRCDYYYYDKDFGGLREMFCMHDLEEEAFDIYREAVNGYEDYETYCMYEKAAAVGVEGAEEKAEWYRQEILENAANCQFEMNQKDLNDYVDNIS